MNVANKGNESERSTFLATQRVRSPSLAYWSRCFCVRSITSLAKSSSAAPTWTHSQNKDMSIYILNTGIISHTNFQNSRSVQHDNMDWCIFFNPQQSVITINTQCANWEGNNSVLSVIYKTYSKHLKKSWLHTWFFSEVMFKIQQTWIYLKLFYYIKSRLHIFHFMCRFSLNKAKCDP